MPSIQNTIIELNFTLLSGRIYKNKAKSAGKHHVRYSYSPLFKRLISSYVSYLSASSLYASYMTCQEASTGNCCEICQGITSLRYGCTLALSPAQFPRRCGTRKLAPIQPL